MAQARLLLIGFSTALSLFACATETHPPITSDEGNGCPAPTGSILKVEERLRVKGINLKDLALGEVEKDRLPKEVYDPGSEFLTDTVGIENLVCRAVRRGELKPEEAHQLRKFFHFQRTGKSEQQCSWVKEEDGEKFSYTFVRRVTGWSDKYGEYNATKRKNKKYYDSGTFSLPHKDSRMYSVEFTCKTPAPIELDNCPWTGHVGDGYELIDNGLTLNWKRWYQNADPIEDRWKVYYEARRCQ